MRRHLLPLLLACLPLLAPALRAQEAQDEAAAAAPQRPHQLVVLSARADRAAGTLTIAGIDFGEEEPRVTLGVLDLEVVSHDAGMVVATLPEEVGAGTYLLIVARGSKVADYDLFHVTIPELPAAPVHEPAAAAPAAKAGPQGAAGPAGPAGPQGPPGPAGSLALAGKRCPAGSVVVGFDAAGNLACEPAGATPALVMPPAAEGTVPAAAATTGVACTDEASPGADLPDTWDAHVPQLASYPQTRSGRVRGTFGTPTDRDHFALFARENDRSFCWNDAHDKPIRAQLVLQAPATVPAAICACWSTPGAPCGRSANLCATAAAGATATLAVPMRMVCGEDDQGTLDVEVRPAAAAPACAPWSVDWQISE